jgi:pimeloyl-ACP methyl ester carboxylesterase
MPRTFRNTCALAMAGLTLCGCAPHLLSFETHAAQVMTYPGAPAVVDGRKRFREILCHLTHEQQAGGHQGADCGGLLWHLDDEGPLESPSPPPSPLPRLRVLIVPGAFEECYPAFGMPFAEEADEFGRRGYFIRLLPVSGRGSSDRNAGEIASEIMRLPHDPSSPIVLVGYSKGAVDILHFTVRYPEIAERVAAVLSVSGAINGSPIADWLSGFYTRVISWMPLPNCTPMDGGVVDSLQRERQLPWLSSNRLPPRIRYFSLVTFARRENIHPLLLFSYDLLSTLDQRNDGYVLWTDQVIPGATLLGYINLDHYDVALPVRERLNIGGQKSRHEARVAIFEAMLLTVSEALSRSHRDSAE